MKTGRKDEKQRKKKNEAKMTKNEKKMKTRLTSHIHT